MKDSVSPGDPIFDVVEQTLGHQGVLAEVHQMRRLNKISENCSALKPTYLCQKSETEDGRLRVPNTQSHPEINTSLETQDETTHTPRLEKKDPLCQ